PCPSRKVVAGEYYGVRLRTVLSGQGFQFGLQVGECDLQAAEHLGYVAQIPATADHFQFERGVERVFGAEVGDTALQRVGGPFERQRVGLVDGRLDGSEHARGVIQKQSRDLLQ